jgi:hypothetical protein
MPEWSRARLALIEATSHAPPDGPDSGAGTAGSSVATGYFMTGSLVLTARHAVVGDTSILVRVESADVEESRRWLPADVVWTGLDDLDAALVKVRGEYESWTPPSTSEVDDGPWESAGYAQAVADPGSGRRKTLPLSGTFGRSGGQGSAELLLRADTTVLPGQVHGWQGMSGAPVFHAGTAELLGVVTDASGAFGNVLIAAPVGRLLADVRFRIALSSNPFIRIPASPWCLVLGSEGGRADLREQVADVLTGFADEDDVVASIDDKPVLMVADRAVASVENWCTAVQALAAADYVVADVSGFQPAVMMLLGVRSALRRGVTVSVSSDGAAGHAVDAPFNVQETRVLDADSEAFHDDLYTALTEGRRSVESDPTYLDLPAYNGIRSPRPDSWAAEDSRSVLVLCPFAEDYRAFYAKTLRSIIRAHTGNARPHRMLDLRSPRLVGQALYEQIRWSTRCLVDLTYWRPNVMFELGVRLACSEHDPLCIVDESASSQDAGRLDSSGWAQLDGLRQLLAPTQYARSAPHETLVPGLDAWATVQAAGPKTSSLPAGATYSVAATAFRWTDEQLLDRPDRLLRTHSEHILGKDQERRPERLVLFADNPPFEDALNVAARQKWVAAWLYLQYLLDGDDPEHVHEAVVIAPLVLHALKESKDRRDVELRQQIRAFIRRARSAATTARESTDGA